MSRISSVMSFILPLLALLAVVGVSNAQRFFPGYCPTVTAHENFDKSRFFGNWIEVEKTPSIFDLMMRCMVVDYSDDQDNTVNVVVRGVSLAGLPLTVNGDGLLQDVHRAGFYSIRYGFGVPFQGTLTTVIDTDYDDYAVVYSCTNSLLSGVFHSEYIWVLSRSGKITNPTRQNIYEKLDKLQINRSGLTMSDRNTCPTNGTNVGRESDKDLAAQGVTGLNSDSALAPATGAATGSAAAGGSNSPVNADQSATNSIKETVPQQKSSAVPLLFDPPSPVSSSSVGGLIKSAGSSSPPSPVENKVQIPIQATNSQQQKQQAAPASPIVKQQGQSSVVPSNSATNVQSLAPSSQASSSSVPVVASPSNSLVSSQQQQQQQQIKPSVQSPPSQSSLLNKLQPKTQ